MTRAATFFVLTFAFSWPFFFAAPRLGFAASAALLLGTFGPSIVALWLTWRDEGSEGVSILVERIFRYRVGWRWYVFAVAFFPVLKLAVALAYRVIEGSWPRFGDESLALIAVAIVLSTPVQSGEEIGWRGYALPRLAARMGYGPAAVLLGAIWGLWHLPLFFIPGEDYGQPVVIFALGTTALSVMLAWVYANTNGSLLLTMLMHSAVNQTVGIVPDTRSQPGNIFSLRAPLTFYLTVAFLWIAAVYLLVRFRSAPAAALRKTAA